MRCCKQQALALAVCGLTLSPALFAAEQPAWMPKMSGFATVGATISDSKGKYLVNDIDNKLDFRNDSVVGLQLDSNLGDGFSFSTQLTAKGSEDHDVEAEWLYGAYQINPNTQVRAGRLRIPSYLASQYHYVGYSYPWIRPPEEVYQQATTTRYHGVELLKAISLGDNVLTIQPFFGNVNDEIDSLGEKADVNSDRLAGLVLQLEGGPYTFRVGSIKTDVELKRGNSFEDKFDATFYTVGAQYDAGKTLLMGEFSRRETDSDNFGDTNGWYTTAGYHLGKYLPYVTYAERKTNNAPQIQKQNSKSFAAGLRYDVNSKVALKAEYQRGLPQDGTRGMYNQLPNKDTKNVNIYSVAATFLF